jgi:peptide/nickel transport system substrate-binding protein
MIRKPAIVRSGILLVALLLALPVRAPAAAETPVRGGELDFVVPASGFPSMDAHREETYAVIHPLRPFYSLLIKVDPKNPSDPTAFVGDVAETWHKSHDGLEYTFMLRKGVKFHDGSPLTSRDVVFRLKFATEAFLPALANPYNWIYEAAILAKDMHWYETHVMGSGPFKFQEYVAGSHVSGVRNPDYFMPGLPYLDGFRAIFIKQEAPELAAIRGGRAMINFRAFPPKAVDELKTAMGDKLAVQESAWNCGLYLTPNHKAKPFDDPRVRRALSLALDRWEGSKVLSKIAIVKTVGGLVFPGSPLAASKAELETVAGYGNNIQDARAEARRLLHAAGVPDGFSFKLHNRAVEQPYKAVGIWVIDQWRQIGLNVEHWVEPTAPFFATLRNGNFQVTMDFNCQAVVNPVLDISKFLSNDRSAANYGQYQDRVLDGMYDEIVHETDQAKLKGLLRRFEKRVLDDQAHYLMTLWWNRIVPYNARVHGWKISPSHYLNQDLANVWLSPQ